MNNTFKNLLFPLSLLSGPWRAVIISGLNCYIHLRRLSYLQSQFFSGLSSTLKLWVFLRYRSDYLNPLLKIFHGLPNAYFSKSNTNSLWAASCLMSCQASFSLLPTICRFTPSAYPQTCHLLCGVGAFVCFSCTPHCPSAAWLSPAFRRSLYSAVLWPQTSLVGLAPWTWWLVRVCPLDSVSAPVLPLLGTISGAGKYTGYVFS